MTEQDLDAFYRTSCDRGFVKLAALARNLEWRTETEWGTLEVTINRSKPEKDPQAIAAAARAGGKSDGYIDPATGTVRSCPLCVTDHDVEIGYARRMRIAGEPWAMWYSPYGYFDHHCIAMSWAHRPMHIDRACFGGMADFVDQVPGYFIGSNADLPIVGGSILSHDHYQGGRHVFPIESAARVREFSLPGLRDVRACVLRWPLTVIRLNTSDRAQLIDAACGVLDAWRVYDDPGVGVVSLSDGQPHNTITPILRKRAGEYELDLVLRCNVTSAEHPLGVFHPHEDVHHVKRENVGLIEVMGRAILPERVLDVMDERGLTRDDIGRTYARVLEYAGVFKWDDAGRAALDRFIGCLA